jgi:hypothetical protein
MKLQPFRVAMLLAITECVSGMTAALLGQGMPCPYASVGKAIRQNNITKLRHVQHNSVKTTTGKFGLLLHTDSTKDDGFELQHL